MCIRDRPWTGDEESALLSASTLAGSLLCDGIGDSLTVMSPFGLERELEITANILPVSYTHLDDFGHGLGGGPGLFFRFLF